MKMVRSSSILAILKASRSTRPEAKISKGRHRGSGHGALAGFLKERDVNVLICGGIGGGAKNALAEAGITLVGGVSGSADQAVRDYLDGNLEFDSEATCDHHGEGEAHHGGNCGHEKCGS